MKPFAIAFVIASIAGALFLYQVNHLSQLEEEAAVLSARIHQHNNPSSGAYIRSFFDGLTLGAFADEGVFTEVKKAEHEGNQLNLAIASLKSRYQSACFYRNGGLIVAVIALVAGLKLKGQTANITPS